MKTIRKWPLLSVVLLAALPAYPALALQTLVIINNNTPAVDQTQRLMSTTPYDKQILEKSPSAVTLTFSQPIAPDKSYIRVSDMYGQQVTDGTVNSPNGTVMAVDLPSLAPGRYSVKWKARCRCNDNSDLNDTFHFTVR